MAVVSAVWVKRLRVKKHVFSLSSLSHPKSRASGDPKQVAVRWIGCGWHHHPQSNSGPRVVFRPFFLNLQKMCHMYPYVSTSTIPHGPPPPRFTAGISLASHRRHRRPLALGQTPHGLHGLPGVRWDEGYMRKGAPRTKRPRRSESTRDRPGA